MLERAYKGVRTSKGGSRTHALFERVFYNCSFWGNLITKHQYDVNQPILTFVIVYYHSYMTYNELNEVPPLLLRIAGLLWCILKKSSIAASF